VDIETRVPPAGAGSLSVTVHVEAIAETNVEGVQANEVGTTGAIRLIVAVFDTLLRVAVRVALWLVPTVPAVAINAVELDAPGTVTETDGTGRSGLLLDNDTTDPPIGAGLVNVTVHVAVFPEFKVVGLHPSEASATEASMLMVALTCTELGTTAEASFEYALSAPVLSTAVAT
jgi:hypothetical protein